MSHHDGAAPDQPAATPMPAASPPQGASEAEVAQRVAEARTEERNRIAAILRAPEAAGRTGLAHALAFDSDMAPDAASRLLAAAAQEARPTPPEGASPLARAMAGAPNPNVGADASQPAAAADDAQAIAANAIALARNIQGVKQ